jgi:hypothetical protein
MLELIDDLFLQVYTPLLGCDKMFLRATCTSLYKRCRKMKPDQVLADASKGSEGYFLEVRKYLGRKNYDKHDYRAAARGDSLHILKRLYVLSMKHFDSHYVCRCAIFNNNTEMLQWALGRKYRCDKMDIKSVLYRGNLNIFDAYIKIKGVTLRSI